MSARELLFFQNVLESVHNPSFKIFFFLFKEIQYSSLKSAVRLSKTIKQNIAESFFRIWEGFVVACLGSIGWRLCRLIGRNAMSVWGKGLWGYRPSLGKWGGIGHLFLGCPYK